MMTLIRTLIAALSACTTAAIACPTCFPTASGLSVHEWGTFTSLSASDGRPLGGLYVDASRLPGFVYGVPFFNYDMAQGGWAPLGKLRHVAVKMETPVLYFYSQNEMDVEVKVSFQGGSISQWFPHAYDSESDPFGSFVDFAQSPYGGHIGWKAKVLAPSTTPLPYSSTASGQETPEWTAPRMVPSNQLRSDKGEIEQFLFYRGIGNFPNTVKLAFQNDSDFTVTNAGEEDIPFLLVYDRVYGNDISGNASVWYKGPLKAHDALSLTHHAQRSFDGSGMDGMNVLKDQLVAAGLSSQEALALLNTWYNGYFIEGGLKAFWILPRAMVDRILPITISPAPDTLKRVIVGRSEILSPEVEKRLRTALADDTLSRYDKDKYWMAYQDYLFPGKEWSSPTALAPYPARDPSRYGSARAGAASFIWGLRRADALGRVPTR